MSIYYLLYKLNNNNTYWIVKTHANIDMLEYDLDDLNDLDDLDAEDAAAQPFR